MRIQISSSANPAGLVRAVALVSRLEKSLLGSEKFWSRMDLLFRPSLQWILTNEGETNAYAPKHELTVYLCTWARVITQFSGGRLPEDSGENLVEMPVKVAVARTHIEIYDDEISTPEIFGVRGQLASGLFEEGVVQSLIEHMLSREAYIGKDGEPYYRGTPTP